MPKTNRYKKNLTPVESHVMQSPHLKTLLFILYSFAISTYKKFLKRHNKNVLQWQKAPTSPGNYLYKTFMTPEVHQGFKNNF
jgi:hypothetical protein